MRLILLLVLAAICGSGQVLRWTRYEAELTAAKTYQNPVQEVRVDVEFRSPSGKEHTVPAFWDDGSTWRVRFSPNEVGSWTWTSQATGGDSGLHGRSGSFECIPYVGSNALYQHGAIRVSSDGHRFEHADGTPFFWLGDTVWNGPLLADRRDWDVFLRDRASKGFNVIQFVTTRWSAAHGDASGRVPYSGVDKIRIDPAFFQRLDQRVNAMNDHGHIAAPVLLWAHTSQPAMNPGVQLPDDQMILLARYMVARYGAHQVVWFLNGDGQYLGASAEKWKRIGRATFSGVHPDRLATLHPGRMTWMTDEYAGEPWFNFTGYQSGHRDDDEHLRWLVEGPPAKGWRRHRPMPQINLEPNYESHRSRTAGATHFFSDFHVRRAAYWSVLVSPPAGVTYGAHGIWSWEAIKAEPLNHRGTGFALPWHEAMKLPGSADMARLKSLMAALPWTKMIPDQDALKSQPGTSDPRHFIAVAKGGGSLVAYLPVGGRVQFEPEAIKGLTRARWYDPRTGQWQAAASYQAPDNKDWVLVLDSGASARVRLVVLTDIGGDPDDQQSMVRLMTYANEFDIEGLIASASGTPGELKEHIVRPELIREIVSAYAQVKPNLARHAENYPEPEDLARVIKAGNRFRGVDAIGAGRDTEGSNWLISVVDRADDRPVNVTVWGGPTDLAQALWRVKNERSEADLHAFVSKLRIHAIGHQDDSGPWILANFPGLFYILSAADPNDVSGRPQKGVDRRNSVYRGMYLGGDELLTSRDWIDSNIRTGHGPLGALYPTKTWTAPNPHGVLKEGDTPSWFYFLANGLGNLEHPEWGGWGGRFRRLNGNLYNDSSEGRASVHRWRHAFQNDFAARMDWCVQEVANHAPVAAPVEAELTVQSGARIALDASGSHDRDGDTLTYRWYVYEEPSTFEGKVELHGSDTSRVAFTAPDVTEARTIHVILEVRDSGTPALTSYRRTIVTVQPANTQPAKTQPARRSNR